MPASAPQTATAPPTEGGGPRRRFRRAHEFWERVTEGLALQELWASFRADARSSYQLYSRDVVRPEEQLPPRHRHWQTFKAFFWSVVMKLSPARRRSEEHTSELQSRGHLVCRLLLEKKKK